MTELACISKITYKYGIYLFQQLINHKRGKERKYTMPKVGIVMGSDSDMKVMGQAADMLEKLGVEYEMTIISAHREPDVFYE